jgi:dihydroorotase
MAELNDAVRDEAAPADLVVVNGRLVTPEGVRAGTVVVRDGRIAGILEPGSSVPPGPTADAEGHYVLPGLIDSHVHFRTPGLEYKEDWAHASLAALAGGVTTVMDMPNTVPPTLDADLVRAKAALAAAGSRVDFAFHIGADPDRPHLLADLDPAVARSAKVFMAGHHTAPTVIRDQKTLSEVFAAAAAGGVRLVLHAEDQSVFDLLDGWRGEAERYDQYEPSRPRTGAIIAVARVIELVRVYGTAVHLLHVSTAEEVDLLVAAAAEGLPATFEVTGHHLSFTDADTCRRGPRTRLSPAIRTQRDQDRLWHAVLSGEARTAGSDHAPHTIEEKSRPAALAPPGLPGVQELAIGLWTGLRGRPDPVSEDVAAATLARLMGSGPADLFQLPGKGRLAVGADADLVLFDPSARWSFSSRDVQAKCGWSAYEGWTFTGRVDATIKAGRIAWDLSAADPADPDAGAQAGPSGASGASGEPAGPGGRWLSAADRPSLVGSRS